MIEKLTKSLFSYCNKNLGFQKPPRLFLKTDEENAANALGKTAYYDPQQQSITIFTTGRHVKDVLRSIAHELIHHHQNERGDLQKCLGGETGPGYAQKNKDLRKMEEEAYLKGNMIFRDWEDSCKAKFQMEENKMKMQVRDLKELIQKSIMEILNKDETTTENAEETEVVNEEEETETVNEEEETETVNEGGMYKREDKEEEDCSKLEEEEEPLEEARDAECEAEARKMSGDFWTNYNNCILAKSGRNRYSNFEESKVMTPEKEKMLKENYMGTKRKNLFDRLVNKWAK